MGPSLSVDTMHMVSLGHSELWRLLSSSVKAPGPTSNCRIQPQDSKMVFFLKCIFKVYVITVGLWEYTIIILTAAFLKTEVFTVFQLLKS